MTMKSKVCEIVQSIFKEPPRFITGRSKQDPGLDHDPRWDCEIVLPDTRSYLVRGLPGSKGEAENEASAQIYNDFFPEWEMRTHLLETFYPDTLPSPPAAQRASVVSKSVVVDKLEGAVIRINNKSAVVRTREPEGKIVICGDAARNLERGMLIEVSVKKTFP